MDAVQTFDMFRQVLRNAITDCFKTLFENKHLYQKVTMDAAYLKCEVPHGVATNMMEKQKLESMVKTQLTLRLNVVRSLHQVPPLGRQYSENEVPAVTIVAPNIKLFCHSCGAAEVFSSIVALDTSGPQERGQSGSAFQLFAFTYQCQRCFTIPQGFLVRRKEWHFYVEGRSPIEHITVSSYIPKVERRFLEDAMLARNSGKILAAMLYLRVFVEQFARRMSGIRERRTGDEILEAYMLCIPENLRSLMPSLKEWYGKLSAAIHDAKEEAELFDDAIAKIDRHFDFRRLYELGNDPIAAIRVQEPTVN